jgi:hypothetical protein
MTCLMMMKLSQGMLLGSLKTKILVTPSCR